MQQPLGARHLVVFTRRPAWGVGKRRLAAELGDLAALRFQRLAIQEILRRLDRDRRWRTWVATSPTGHSDWLRGAVGRPQGRGELGVRLTRVIVGLPKGPVVVIGGDAPGVRARDIAAAFHCLGAADAVIGPAADGGYWLIGLRGASLARRAFAGVRWSSALTLADTVANLRGRRVAMLRTLEDVDDGATHARFVQTLNRSLRVLPIPD
ncbi:MAG TPA: DUF2064 domain-containing protein [Caulobacteraceae bacterium]